VVGALGSETIGGLLLEHAAETLHGSQGGAHVVGDGVGEMLKLANGILKPRCALGHERFELGGAISQLCLRRGQQLLRLLALGDVGKSN